jgi:hypothetical protein
MWSASRLAPGWTECDHVVMIDGPVVPASDPRAENLELRKEAYTMALYVAVCLIAALIAMPEGDEALVIGIIWGITIGLALAHLFAFRVSARLVGAGRVRSEDLMSAAAQLLGAAAVGVLATIPAVLVPRSVELLAVELTLAAFIACAGYLVARIGGSSRVRAVLYAVIVLALAVAIALIKNGLAGH